MRHQVEAKNKQMPRADVVICRKPSPFRFSPRRIYATEIRCCLHQTQLSLVLPSSNHDVTSPDIPRVSRCSRCLSIHIFKLSIHFNYSDQNKNIFFTSNAGNDSYLIFSRWQLPHRHHIEFQSIDDAAFYSFAFVYDYYCAVFDSFLQIDFPKILPHFLKITPSLIGCFLTFILIGSPVLQAN